MSDAYKMELPGCGITLEVDRLRRERHELIGELTVRCDLPETKSVNGCISVGDFNFSSVRARQERSKLLKQRANLKDLDWFTVLEDLCQNVVRSEREGNPDVDLRTIARPDNDEIQLDGLVFPRRHPTIVFGDGGAAKSYTALYSGGQLAKQRMKIALFDWELCGEEHRERLERLFGSAMPEIRYCRCERPLVAEVDRLRRIVRERQIDYAIFDSIAFACDGPPEAAEVAGRYFRAVREIGVGSLHVAHVNRSENNDKKPFGSTFWHNGARSTWYVESSNSQNELHLAFHNRKANLGPLRPAVGFVLKFTKDRTSFELADVAENPDLAEKLPIRTRIAHAVRNRVRTVVEIAEEIGARPDTVARTIRRYKEDFIELEDGRIVLREKH